jgi:hypothetical protein
VTRNKFSFDDRKSTIEEQMPDRRHIAFFATGGITGFVLALLILLVFHRQAPTDADCADYLNALWDIIELYKTNHHGEFPPSLTAAATPFGGQIVAMKCPLGKNDYVYIDWSREPRGADWEAGDYPMVYDAKLSNHSDRGIFILTVNRTIIWAPKGAWLEGFVETHATDHIPIPQ